MGLRTVRGRLWAALALLSVAVLSASAVTWLALQRVDARLQDLHQETLSQVAQALDLSKRSSDLATSAPYLLNQRSNFLIEQEGGKLIRVLDRVRTDWPEARFGNVSASDPVVSPIIDDMSAGVKDLVAASSQLELIQAQIRNQTAKLGTLRTKATTATTSKRMDDQSRLIWWSLQSMNADALNAAYAGNLIGVGEEQRHYLRQKQTLDVTIMTVEQTAFLADLEAIVWRANGVFELRRRELSANLSAQNALFRIRHDANLINELASDYANQAEVFLANERMASSSTIRVTRVSVAVISAISLILALTAAIYVSRYVTFNISRVSAAMVRLANGDRASALPRKLGGEDEIGDLFRSFRSFRANALRLDRSNRQLDQRNALFEKVFTNISDGIAMTDPSGRLTAFNPAFSKILGWPAGSPQVGMWVEWLLDSRFGQSAMKSGLKTDHRGVCDLISEDGQILEIRASKLPDDGRVWLIGDVTEQRRISDRLQQIDRIETLGRMAGDTAHDFANILSTIRTHAHLLECHQGDETNDSLQAIGNAVDFGSSLTDRLLAFARKQSLVPELVELNALVEGMADLIEISLKPGVKLEVSVGNLPLNVLVDPGQLESALFNLLLNANNAITAKGSIKVSLDSRNATHAYILVEDDGHGMSDDVLARAIEPFYTTRNDVGGTGLGLSIVYGFIRQTGGDITIESVPDRGTKIELSLPVVVEISSGLKFNLTKSALLVEDDKKTCDHATALLQQLGYEVASFATGEEALKATQLRSFDLVLSDFELGGGLNGSEVLSRLAQSTPMMKSIMMSGKSAAKTSAQDGVNFIEKPLTLQKLVSALEVAMPSASTYRGLQS
jgi:signal transduction histidine kinase/CheY-like chemotaxis protein/HAMP domain-containing protein